MSAIKATVDQLNALNPGTLCENLGIEFIDVGETHVTARMPVDPRTIQPFGLLHGGASVALAETLGSVASQMVAGLDRTCVGVEINANHLKSIKQGFVYGTARPLRLGKNMHVWNIEIIDDYENLICISRLTVLVKGKPSE
ncbi:MAG: hypothetical protein DHS20C17_33190 [Cyclobacteriaceae bacterium]|nr:MAG: hypothetical protein DHS20C17_33190 [Cyclobacteriaceae bacterium]